MKKTKKHIILLYIIICILIGFIIFSNKGIMLDNAKTVLKEMSETEQITNLNNDLNLSNIELSDYKTYIQTSKKDLADAITEAGVTTREIDSFETMVSNIRSIVRFDNLENKIVYNSTQIMNGTVKCYTIEEDGTYLVIASVGGLWASSTKYYNILINSEKNNTVSYNLVSGSAVITQLLFLGELKVSDIIGFSDTYAEGYAPTSLTVIKI